jgi:hypothetical protein
MEGGVWEIGRGRIVELGEKEKVSENVIICYN